MKGVSIQQGAQSAPDPRQEHRSDALRWVNNLQKPLHHSILRYLLQMNQTPTDRPALLWQRACALHTGPVDFLTAIAIDEVQERLVAVNRSFTKVAIIGGWMPGWAGLPDATHVADAETLDLEVQSYDLVVHALCLQGGGPCGPTGKARRALVPDGLLLVVAFGGRSLVELRAVLAEAEIALTGGLSPRVLPRQKFDMGGLLQRADLRCRRRQSSVDRDI